MSKSTLKIGFIFLACTFLASCISAPIEGTKPNGEKIYLQFYTGGSHLDDLFILEGQNYFGKAGYQIDDPEGDISFRLLDGRRIRAECTLTGKNSIDRPECQEYTVYNSNFDGIPKGTRFLKPKIF